jgi:hypothetical protein
MFVFPSKEPFVSGRVMPLERPTDAVLSDVLKALAANKKEVKAEVTKNVTENVMERRKEGEKAEKKEGMKKKQEEKAEKKEVKADVVEQKEAKKEDLKKEPKKEEEKKQEEPKKPQAEEKEVKAVENVKKEATKEDVKKEPKKEEEKKQEEPKKLAGKSAKDDNAMLEALVGALRDEKNGLTIARLGQWLKTNMPISKKERDRLIELGLQKGVIQERGRKGDHDWSILLVKKKPHPVVDDVKKREAEEETKKGVSDDVKKEEEKEKRRLEEEHAEDERRRRIDQEKKREEEERKRVAEEKKREEDERRRIDQEKKRKEEEEKKRVEEEERNRAAEEKKRKEEEEKKRAESRLEEDAQREKLADSLFVGMDHPVEDFLAVVAAGKSDRALDQLQRVVMQLVEAGNHDLSVRCLAAMRGQCVLSQHHELWNTFLPLLRDHQKRDFWPHVVRARLQLITTEECAGSTFSQQDAERLLGSAGLSEQEYASQFAVGMNVVVSLAADDKWEPAKVMFVGPLDLARVEKNAVFVGVVLP